jgi:hypothetical protein
VTAKAGAVVVRAGDDWTLPLWSRPAPNSGFFSEDASPEDHVWVRSVDLSWSQVQPAQGDALDRNDTGSAQGMSFGSLDDQLAEPGPFWMRLFASGEDWAPAWVAKTCGVSTYGPDYDGEKHLPIWDDCVWSALLDTYRKLFADTRLAADPRLRFVYVPGAFTWAEYDYETIQAAVDAGDLDAKTYLAWYAHAWSDLAAIFGPDANKLVFTGEDYPWGPFGADDDLLAAQAVDAGIGIRDGITEEFNFHLSEAPAYGSHIQRDGHLVVDETLPVHDGARVVATENECFTDCGFTSKDPEYVVRQSNLKALQLRMNWIYVVPGPSDMVPYAPHWDWVRLSLGQTAATSADAWADLRDAEDTYWNADSGEGDGPFTSKAAWRSRPYVRNLERWLVQVDVPGAVAHRTNADVHRADPTPENGTAYEGLRTSVHQGDRGFAFRADPAFLGQGAHDVVVKVTYLDRGNGGFTVVAPGATSAVVPRRDDGKWKTATVLLPRVAFDRSLAAKTDLRLVLDPGASDLVVRFVRVVRADPAG